MEAAVARHIFFAFDSKSKTVNKSEQPTLQEQPKEKEADNEEEGTGKNIGRLLFYHDILENV